MFYLWRESKQNARKQKKINSFFKEDFSNLLTTNESYDYDHIFSILNKENKLYKIKNKDYILNLLIELKNTKCQENDGRFNECNYANLINAGGLPEYLQKELISGNNSQKKRALNYISQLNQGCSYRFSSSILANLSNYREDDIRKQAKCEFLKNDDHEEFKFLDNDYDKNFTKLDELRIHEALKKKSNERELPLLISWILESKDEDYKRFMIREIANFKQTGCIPYLNDLYRTSGDKIKAQILESLNDLGYNFDYDFLEEQYNTTNSTHIQNIIIDIISQSEGARALRKLPKMYHNTKDNNTRQQIIEKIDKLGENGKLAIAELYNKASETEKINFEKYRYSFS